MRTSRADFSARSEQPSEMFRETENYTQFLQHWLCGPTPISHNGLRAEVKVRQSLRS